MTRRVRLMPSVLLAPLRNPGVLAKQVASLDALSAGRVTLGLGVGGREDDYRAAPAPFRDRGRRFEAQLEVMKRIWSGQPLADDAGAVGPPPVQPGGPPLLIGGSTPAAVRRVARWGDGFIAAGASPEQARQLYGLAEAAWTAAGRPGRPRFVGGTYWALGPGAAERAAAYIRDYYAFLGPMAEGFAASIPSTPEAVKAVIDGARGGRDGRAGAVAVRPRAGPGRPAGRPGGVEHPAPRRRSGRTALRSPPIPLPVPTLYNSSGTGGRPPVDTLTAARVQMEVSLAFHMIFAAVGMAMPLMMLIAEWRWLRYRDRDGLGLARTWAKVTAVLFAIGAVSGHGALLRAGPPVAPLHGVRRAA